MQSDINIQVGDKAPEKYFNELREQCNLGELKYGGITNFESLLKNMEENSIPVDVFEMNINKYNEFLEKRRVLMAKKIREYYYSL